MDLVEIGSLRSDLSSHLSFAVVRREQLHEHHTSWVDRIWVAIGKAEKEENIACLLNLRETIEQHVQMKGDSTSSFVSFNKILELKVEEA